MRTIETLTHDAAVYVHHGSPAGDFSIAKRDYMRTNARHHAGKSGYTRTEETFFVAAIDYLYRRNCEEAERPAMPEEDA